jgi:hypothetical protein
MSLNWKIDSFSFGRFAHDPQSVLAAIYRLAFMGIERLPNFTQCLSPRWIGRLKQRSQTPIAGRVR